MEFKEIVYNLLIGLGTGVISGLITGYIVYKLTKKREENYETYLFCSKFLFSALEKCEMYIPVDTLNYISKIDENVDSPWRTSTQNILDYINPFGHEDKELSNKEHELLENFMTAFGELEKWKNKKHLYKLLKKRRNKNGND